MPQNMVEIDGAAKVVYEERARYLVFLLTETEFEEQEGWIQTIREHEDFSGPIVQLQKQVSEDFRITIIVGKNADAETVDHFEFDRTLYVNSDDDPIHLNANVVLDTEPIRYKSHMALREILLRASFRLDSEHFSLYSEKINFPEPEVTIRWRDPDHEIYTVRDDMNGISDFKKPAHLMHRYSAAMDDLSISTVDTLFWFLMSDNPVPQEYAINADDSYSRMELVMNLIYYAINERKIFYEDGIHTLQTIISSFIDESGYRENSGRFMLYGRSPIAQIVLETDRDESMEQLQMSGVLGLGDAYLNKPMYIENALRIALDRSGIELDDSDIVELKTSM